MVLYNAVNVEVFHSSYTTEICQWLLFYSYLMNGTSYFLSFSSYFNVVDCLWHAILLRHQKPLCPDDFPMAENFLNVKTDTGVSFHKCSTNFSSEKKIYHISDYIFYFAK